VLLQQTRVAAAVPYFERFIARFPTVASLASASREEVLKLWEGAGYYDRATRLHAAAQWVVANRAGRLPRSVEAWEELPGVGRYIARAITSLAFDTPVVALEANGLRIAARWTEERGDLRRGAVRARLATALAEVGFGGRPGDFNEALMELGETVCRPVAPLCDACPVRPFCQWGQGPRADPVPARAAGRSSRHVVAAVAAIERRGRWLVQQRPVHGRLAGLWEFPGGTVEVGETPEAACRRELREEVGLRPADLEFLGIVRHAYTNFTVELHLFAGRAPTGARARGPQSPRWLTPEEFARLPRPRATIKAVELLAARARGPEGPFPGSRRPMGRAPA
jgi:A/G-specific adenine glycosylase